jgi:histidine ammonia-lyase
MSTLHLDGNSLSISDVARIAYDPSIKVALTDDALAAMGASRDVIENWVAKGKVIYGVTTGFGELRTLSSAMRIWNGCRIT